MTSAPTHYTHNLNPGRLSATDARFLESLSASFRSGSIAVHAPDFLQKVSELARQALSPECRGLDRSAIRRCRVANQESGLISDNS